MYYAPSLCHARKHRPQSEYETPHGRIDLSSCMTVKSAEQKTSKRNALEVSTHDTTYFMYANTEKVTSPHTPKCI